MGKINADQLEFEPNRDPGFGGVPSDIESKNVQEAIEEAKVDAINNDRFIALCSYGGQANVGRYLEFFGGIASDEAQILLIAASRLLSVLARSTSPGQTAQIGIFDLNVSSTVPIYTVTFNNQQQVVNAGTPTLPLAVTAPNARIAVRVVSGSIAKPHLIITLSAAT